jgi:membrane protein DedA with SNARE-associated domain
MEGVLAAHHAWLIFFGAFLFGETLIIPAAALAAQGQLSPWAVGGWAYLGTVVSDTLWFRLAGLAGRHLSNHEGSRRRYLTVLAWLDRRFGARPERALLFVKFVYGTRIATIIYLSARKLKLRLFVAYNASGAVLWVVVIVTVGWLAGRGLAILGRDLSRAERLLPIVLLLALLLKGAVTWISKRALSK